MRLVMKFGGSTLASEKGLERVASIVKQYAEGNEIVVVVSAIGDATDILLEAAQSAKRWDSDRISQVIARLRELHAKATSESGLPSDGVVYNLLDTLQTTLMGISILGELSPRSKDLVMSFGERLAAPLVAAALAKNGVKSLSLTGGEAGVVTDGSYGEAAVDMAKTKPALAKRIGRMLRDGEVPVVTGFIAGTADGDITTLGRGGSDYTATLLAYALDADEVWIWTDVDGIMTADPRLVPGARVLEEVSYAEAEEMAVFGAKNMHPLALGPARVGRMPVRIRNSFRPSWPGTLIVDRQKKTPGVAKSVALVKDVCMITVAGESLAGRPGTAAKVFGLLGAASVNIMMISQSVSEMNISCVVGGAQGERAARALTSGLAKEGISVKVEVDPDVSVLAVVGAGMRGTPGVAARLLTAIAREDVDVRMIAEGSSELSLSMVVEAKSGGRTLLALHDALVPGVR